MTTKKQSGAYREVVALMDSLGGTMEYHAGGYPGGGDWKLQLGSFFRKVSVREWPVGGNALDRLYVQGTYSGPDMTRELWPDAPERLVRFLVGSA